MSAVEAIRASRLVAILRSPNDKHLAATAEALITAGIRTLEFPLGTPGVLSAISTTVTRFGDTACIGAGTIRSVDDARRAIDAGATFLVAPGLSAPVVDYAYRRNVPMLPGVFTPTEIDTAARAGARLVKLFPASSHSPDFLRQVRAPIPEVEVMPTGGVTLDTARAWLDAGAVALGIGSPLTGDCLTTGDFAPLRTSTRRWLEIVASGA